MNLSTVLNLSAPDGASAAMPSLASVMKTGIGLNNLTVADVLSSLITLVVCLLVIRTGLHVLRRLLDRSKLEERIKKYIVAAAKGLLSIIAAIIVAESLNISTTSIVAVLSVCGLALSLAVEGVLGNMAGGLLIIITKPFVVGDFIEASGVSGTVVEISLNSTKLDTYEGYRVLLPNKTLSGGQLTNYSTLGRRRIAHTVYVGYEAPVETVRAALLEAAAQTPNLLSDPVPAAQVEKYGQQAVEYSIRCWADTEHYWSAYYDLLHNLKGALSRHDVEMTYNHINVHIQNP